MPLSYMYKEAKSVCVLHFKDTRASINHEERPVAMRPSIMPSGAAGRALRGDTLLLTS